MCVNEKINQENKFCFLMFMKYFFKQNTSLRQQSGLSLELEGKKF